MSDLWNQISRRARQNPDATALSDSNADITLNFRQMVQRVEALTANLKRLNEGSIGLLAENGFDWVICDLASLAAARCLIPVPLFFTASQREHALDDAGATWLVAAPTTPLPTCYQPIEALPGLDNLILWHRNTPMAETNLPPGTVKITYTSGSTGEPKGVCLNESLIAEVANTLAAVTCDIPVKKHLCVLPLAILLENIAGIYTPLLRGAEIAVPSLATLGLAGSSTIEPSRFLKTIAAEQPQSMILIPQLLSGLLEAARAGWTPPESLLYIAVGGGHVSRQLLEEAHNIGLPVYQGYGLSECGSVVSLNLPGKDRIGSVGKPLPHASVNVIDGEIHIHKQLFLGYSGNCSTENVAGSATSLPTGDLGYLDEEGFLYITGRKKNVLISSFGRNISPEWIEAELNTIPGVVNSMVIGEAQPYLCALIAAAPNRDEKHIDAAIKRINASLPDYAQIRDWLRLPASLSTISGTLTENGRLKRQAILEKFRDQIDSLYPIQHLSDRKAPRRRLSPQSE